MMRYLFAALCCVLFLPLGSFGAEPLGPRLEALAAKHKGQVAIAFKHLSTGESCYFHADLPMSTASLIKLPVMIETYQQVAEGKIKLSDMLTLRKEDKVPGSGVLTNHFTDGLQFSLRDAVHLMIALSDNTATNMVLDHIGIPATGKRMASWGYPHTKVYAKSFKGTSTSIDPAGTRRFGLGSTTAREMVGLLEKLHQGELVSPASSKEMIAILKQCEDHEKFIRFLPPAPEVSVAHKSGSTSEIRAEGGILYFSGGPVALCVLTDKNADHRWIVDNEGNLFCARVAKEVYDHFQKSSSQPSPVSRQPDK
jgi:beta-lactamase class A